MPETLLSYRQRLGAKLGFHILTTTTGVGSTPDQLVIAALADSELETSFSRWVYAMPTEGANAGLVRRIKKEGLAPGTGTLTATAVWPNTTASGVDVELYGVLPPSAAYGQDGLLECLNNALAECWTIDALSLTGVADQYQYSLATAYPWLYQADQIIDVWIRRSGAVRDELVREWRFLYDAEGPVLELRNPISTADTLKPRVYRPLNTWIKTGSPSATWQASTTGLVSDTDQALLTLEGAEVVGLAHAYEVLAQFGSGAEQSLYGSLAAKQRVKANLWKRDHLPRMTPRSAHWNESSAGVFTFPREGSLG